MAACATVADYELSTFQAMWFAAVALGVLMLALGAYRLLNPDWERQGVLSSHPSAVRLLVKGLPWEFARGRAWFERDAVELLDAALQAVGGLLVVLCGALLLIYT